jgi:crossover junction endodeoxyribonuclease RusA
MGAAQSINGKRGGMIINVTGNPVPKQSFRYVKGGGYTPLRVKEWQETVAVAARRVMDGASPIEIPVKVKIDFYMPTKRRMDLDNLSKGVLDALNGIVYLDDKQIVHLELTKGSGFGCRIEITEVSA